MSANKEYFLRMRAEEFERLSNEVRGLFTYVELRESYEYENNKEDKYYLSLKKAERKAKNDVQKYLFSKRHPNK